MNHDELRAFLLDLIGNSPHADGCLANDDPDNECSCLIAPLCDVLTREDTH